MGDINVARARGCCRGPGWGAGTASLDFYSETWSPVISFTDSGVRSVLFSSVRVSSSSVATT